MPVSESYLVIDQQKLLMCDLEQEENPAFKRRWLTQGPLSLRLAVMTLAL